MSRGPRPRDSINHRREVLPRLGVDRPVEITDTFDEFLSNVETGIRLKLQGQRGFNAETPLRKLGITLRDDLDEGSTGRPAVSIFERRFSARHGQKHRITWTKQDNARVRSDINNQIARLSEPDEYLPNGGLRVSLTNVVRLGDGEQSKRGQRKFGVVVDQESTAAERLLQEHEIVFNGIQTSLKRFVYPYSEYVPHVHIGTFIGPMEDTLKNDVMKVVQDLLPLQVTLEPIRMISTQQIR